MSSASLSSFQQSGEGMHARIRAFDWSSTPIGPLSTWAVWLRVTVDQMLASKIAGCLFWGDELIAIHNVAFLSILAGKPDALGRPTRESWGEPWTHIEPIARTALAGESTFVENSRLQIDRNGALESRYFTFNYGPVFDEHGAVVGVMVTGLETTSLVMAEQRAHEERLRQQNLLQQMPGFVAVLSGPEHVFDYVNDAYVAISGPRDFIGRPVRAVFPELEGQGFYELLDQVFSSGESMSATAIPILLDRDSGSRHIDLLYEPIRDHAGHVQGIFVGGYDVTERVRAEAELRDRETRLRQLNAELEQRVNERAMAIGRSWHISPDLLCVLDTQGRFTAANPAFEKTLGWTEQEVTSTVFASFVHPDDLAATYAAWSDMVERDLPALRFQNRWLTKQGGIRWNSWVGVPDGEEMYCIGRDVTAERQQAERLAKRTVERDILATIVESTDALIQVMDLDYRFLAINKANADEYERAFGKRPVVGDSLIEMLSDLPEHQEEVLAMWRRALTGDTFTLQAELGEPTRARRTYDMKFEVLRGADGAQTGAFLTSTDVTDRVGAQRALADAQEALRQSQKMEAVGQLTGGVAHDFNNLLTVISTSVSLLRRHQTSDDQRQRSIDAISKTVKRASKLTGQLLAFARRQALTPTVFDAAQNVMAVVDMLGTLVGARIQVETIMGADCHINADPGQFDTAMVNLVVNARDAMDGAGRLTVSVRQVTHMPARRAHAARDGDFVAASVIDTGCGINAKNLERIFEPFYTTKAAGHGTGLGLSQVFGFAKQSGGEVQVESEIGNGTAFTLYFPRAAAKRENDVADTAVPRDKAQSGTVLVVEDNLEVAAAVESSLVELGYSSVHAIDANQALKKLESQAEKIAVVFSDGHGRCCAGA